MNKIEIKKLINRDNPVIFEIGCADGIDTFEFLEVFGSNSTFYCFEPDNRNAEVFVNGGFRPLNHSLTQGINFNNVIFENKAIGKENGQLIFNQSSTIYSSSLKNPTDKLSQTWPDISFENQLIVDCVTLDKYVSDKNIDVIDFIWADVQGAEDYMIEGGRETFKNKVRYLYTEYANNVEYYENSPNKEQIRDLLGDNWVIIQDFGSDVLLKNKKFDDNN
jgi:FkbM family methyltransferase